MFLMKGTECLVGRLAAWQLCLKTTKRLVGVGSYMFGETTECLKV